jgi:UDP-N-acetylmuramoylalanine--D-glutamate ligase
VAVLGAARSGLAAARLLARSGARVTLWDERPLADLGPVASELAAAGTVLQGGVPLGGVDLGRPDLLVVSPGVPLALSSIMRARSAGCPVWGEVELAGRFLRPGSAVLGVTGTNGKSTTTALLGALCEAGGLALWQPRHALREAMGGARGTCWSFPASSWKSRTSASTARRCSTSPRPPRSLRLARGLRRGQGPSSGTGAGDVAVVAPATQGRWDLEGTQGARFAFTAAVGRRRSGHRQMAGPARRFRLAFASVSLVRNRALRGAHNRANAMAAALLAFHAGVKPEALQAGLDGFPGLAHRLESVRVLDGVEWVNDSKATNVDAVLTALAAFSPGQRLWLIAGGKGKGAPYAPLVQAAVGKVAGLLTVGQDGLLLQREFAPVCPVHSCETLERAVARGRELARPGDVVLLSPACASYDQFRNFEHRGEVFKALWSVVRTRRPTPSRCSPTRGSSRSATRSIRCRSARCWPGRPRTGDGVLGQRGDRRGEARQRPHFLERQLIAAGVGLVALAAAVRLGYRKLARLAFPCCSSVWDSSSWCWSGVERRWAGERWLRCRGSACSRRRSPSSPGGLPGLPLAKKREKVATFSVGFLPHLLLAGVLVALCMAEPDFGSSVELLVLLFILLFAAGTKLSYLVGSVLLALPMAWAAVAHSPYRWARIKAFLDPWADRHDIGYQVAQSLIPVGSGGFFGRAGRASRSSSSLPRRTPTSSQHHRRGAGAAGAP